MRKLNVMLTPLIGDGNDILIGGIKNDTLDGGAGTDIYVYNKGDGVDNILETTYGNILRFGAGIDYLAGGDGGDTLDGRAGNDTLDAGACNDTYQFGRGDGHATISSNDTTVGKTDQLLLNPGVASTDDDLNRTHDDLALTIRDTGDSITLKNHFLAESANPNGIEQITFADGTAWDFWAIKSLLPTIASDGNDTLYGSATCAVLFWRNRCEAANDQCMRKAV